MTFLGLWLFQISRYYRRLIDILIICRRYEILKLEYLFTFIHGEVGEQMIKTLRIQKFRCFQDLSVKDLSSITLFR